MSKAQEANEKQYQLELEDWFIEWLDKTNYDERANVESTHIIYFGRSDYIKFPKLEGHKGILIKRDVKGKITSDLLIEMDLERRVNE